MVEKKNEHHITAADWQLGIPKKFIKQHGDDPSSKPHNLHCTTCEIVGGFKQAKYVPAHSKAIMNHP